VIAVELYGVPRLRAGAARVEVPPGRLGEVLAALAAAAPGLVPEIVREGRLTEHALIALEGREFLADLEREVADGSVLVLISAQAGG